MHALPVISVLAVRLQPNQVIEVTYQNVGFLKINKNLPQKLAKMMLGRFIDNSDKFINTVDKQFFNRQKFSPPY